MPRTDPFWTSIDKALERIRTENPDTFDGVRDILHAHGDPDGISTQGTDNAFFGGSGGDSQLRPALGSAGWVTVWAEASYYYVMIHTRTGELLSYIEGDVQRGAHGDSPNSSLRADMATYDGTLIVTEDDRGRLLSIRVKDKAPAVTG